MLRERMCHRRPSERGVQQRAIRERVCCIESHKKREMVCYREPQKRGCSSSREPGMPVLSVFISAKL